VKALGGKNRKSICEDDKQDLTRNFAFSQRKRGSNTPVDVVAADAFANDAQTQVVDVIVSQMLARS
jgi:phosphoglycerate kinase